MGRRSGAEMGAEGEGEDRSASMESEDMRGRAMQMQLIMPKELSRRE